MESLVHFRWPAGWGCESLGASRFLYLAVVSVGQRLRRFRWVVFRSFPLWTTVCVSAGAGVEGSG
jgi:hypothetical protein